MDVFNGSTVFIVDALSLKWGEERKTEVHVHTETHIHIHISLPWFQELPFENHWYFNTFLLE